MPPIRSMDQLNPEAVEARLKQQFARLHELMDPRLYRQISISAKVDGTPMVYDLNTSISGSGTPERTLSGYSPNIGADTTPVFSVCIDQDGEHELSVLPTSNVMRPFIHYDPHALATDIEDTLALFELVEE